jgi:hypothetical protein
VPGLAESPFTAERAEAAALRCWTEHDLARAVASVETGTYPVTEARREFFAFGSIRADLAGIKPELARRVLVGLLDEVLPLLLTESFVP